MVMMANGKKMVIVKWACCCHRPLRPFARTAADNALTQSQHGHNRILAPPTFLTASHHDETRSVALTVTRAVGIPL